MLEVLLTIVISLCILVVGYYVIIFALTFPDFLINTASVVIEKIRNFRKGLTRSS